MKKQKPNISNARLDQLAAIMVRSNTAAKVAAIHLVGRRKYFQFREALANRPAEGLTKSQLGMIAMIPRTDQLVMLEVEGIMEEITIGFTPMRQHLARFFVRKQKGFEQGDLENQAWLFLRKAVYGYDNPKYKIVAYFWKTLLRELQRYILSNCTCRLASKSSDYHEILRACLEAETVLWQKLYRQPHFEEIYECVRNQFASMNGNVLREKVQGVLRCVVTDFNYYYRHAETEEYELIDINNTMADKTRLTDVRLESLPAIIDARDQLEGMLTNAEISDIGRAVLMDRAMETPIKEIATKLKVPAAKIKNIFYSTKRKLRRIA